MCLYVSLYRYERLVVNVTYIFRERMCVRACVFVLCLFSHAQI